MWTLNTLLIETKIWLPMDLNYTFARKRLIMFQNLNCAFLKGYSNEITERFSKITFLKARGSYYPCS